MEKEFIITESRKHESDTGRHKSRKYDTGRHKYETDHIVSHIIDGTLRFIETHYGKIVALESMAVKNVYTVVPGFYRKKLPKTETGLRKIKVETVPEEQRDGISKILRKEGYRGTINFWK